MDIQDLNLLPGMTTEAFITPDFNYKSIYYLSKDRL